MTGIISYDAYVPLHRLVLRRMSGNFPSKKRSVIMMKTV